MSRTLMTLCWVVMLGGTATVAIIGDWVATAACTAIVAATTMSAILLRNEAMARPATRRDQYLSGHVTTR